MLDIALFRTDKGGDPEIVRESQRRRFADVTLVDQVIALDTEWREKRGRVDVLNRYVKRVSAIVGKKMKAKEDQGASDLEVPAEWLVRDDALDAVFKDKATSDAALEQLRVSQLRKLSKFIADQVSETQEELKRLENERQTKLVLIGNLVHESCVVSDDEDNNGIVKEHGELRRPTEDAPLLNHVDIMRRMGCMHTEQGAVVAGNRGYFLTGDLVRLNLALINYSIDFLSKRGYTPIYPPYFMQQNIMAEVAQLEQFDEELYKVTGEGEDKYLIATSEQPIAAYHRNQWFDEKQLPIKYVGYSACFRKEVGSHGKDTLGIFRVHQFEKIEQFCVTSPKDGKSWEMLETMMENSEDFYQSLGLAYRVVNIVSGKLNNAAAKKLDLEAWFPASETYRELVSCSNCTDYQSRRLEVRYGTGKNVQGEKEYVHMLNATLCATTRTMCCLVETYQTPEGIKVPEVLQPYMGGTDFIPFKN